MIIKFKEWPSLWKCTTITPIYKSDDPESVEIYRPISILPQLSIIFEKLLFRYSYSHVRKKVCTEQHGFMRQRSTVTQLLPFLDELYNRKDSNIPNYGVYFDFRKASDLVPHHLLLHKLADFGFDSGFLHLFQSYLSSRFQLVSVNGVLSQLSKVTRVPQGSVVGPLFLSFLLTTYPTTSQNRHVTCSLMIANYLDPFLTYNMTLSTFRIGPSKISSISILINAKVSTLMDKINQALLSCWMEMKFLLSTASKTWVLIPKLNIMERPHSGEVSGSSQVFLISETHHAS